jgi:hypothetical protein
LDFAQVFAKGGYDLQVGNPPWVRPRWQEDVVLAELEPWFVLAEKPSVAEWRLHKGALLRETGSAASEYFLRELATNVGTVAVLGGAATYPLLTGTQPDLYRAFMCQVWANSNSSGMAGMIHPDTHFAGVKEGTLRAATYRHLRTHAHFSNRLQLFDEIEGTRQFSVNIYGSPSDISFTHVSWLFSPETLLDSLLHNGHGPLPGIKHEGKWELRPHKARLLTVEPELLALWNQLSRDDSVPDDEAALLYPVTTNEQDAIASLSNFRDRVGAQYPNISTGYHEKTGKEEGYIRWSTRDTSALSELVLQGPHLVGATPFNKQPNNPCKTNRDWSAFDLTTLPIDAIPRTNYVRACDLDRFQAAQDRWNGRPYTQYFRVAWRFMIPFDTERSLFAALIPPGPSHINGVHSMALRDNYSTSLNAGFWSSLPLDYLLRIAGRANLMAGEALRMPAPTPDHPLSHPLLLRSLRLNSLTDAYAPLWHELFHPTWPGYEDWAYGDWPNLKPLAWHLKPTWVYDTPLRTEYERRAALVELDALVSVWLGITADQLVAIYKSRYPVLSDYEAEMYFDANGRKIARNHNTYGHGQTKETYPSLLAHLETPGTAPPPEGYEPPFYKADREAEMRGAHAHFQARLDAEIAAGRWTPPEPTDDEREVPVGG